MIIREEGREILVDMALWNLECADEHLKQSTANMETDQNEIMAATAHSLIALARIQLAAIPAQILNDLDVRKV